VTYVDLAIFGVPLILGLILMWRGVGRSLLSMPVRLLVSLILGWLASGAAVIYFDVSQASLLDWTGNRLGLSRLGVLTGLRYVTGAIVVVALMLVSGRMRAYLVRDDANVTVGAAERVARFGVGAVLGLVFTLILVVPNYMFLEAFASDPEHVPTVFRNSISLPLIKHISDRAKSMLERVVPSN